MCGKSYLFVVCLVSVGVSVCLCGDGMGLFGGRVGGDAGGVFQGGMGSGIVFVA